MEIINILIEGQSDKVKIIAQSLRNLRNSSFHFWISRNLSKLSPYNQWKDAKIIENDTPSIEGSCFQWNSDTASSAEDGDFVHRCLLSRSLSYKSRFIVVSDTVFPCGQMVLFNDVKSDKALPDVFHHFDCYEDSASLLEYLRKNKVIPEISLSDKNLFEKASGFNPQQGAVVHRELSTRRLWYADNLHKDHYEVFDPSGQHHLGIVRKDGGGELEPNSADPSKKPIC